MQSKFGGITVSFSFLCLAYVKLPDVHNPQNIQLQICGPRL